VTWARDYAREVVAKVADAVSGGELIEIDTAHVSGVSYVTLGRHGVEFLEALANEGARVSVPTTANPPAYDLFGSVTLIGEEAELQRRAVSSLLRMGVSLIPSCAPYEVLRVRPGTVHAWAESSAAAYINIFRGALSDKVPGPLALMAAIAGAVPRTQMYTRDGRRPRILAEYRGDVLDSLSAGLLGMVLGEVARDRVPLLRGVRFLDESARREFAAALSTYSQLVFAVVEGETPGWERYVAEADVEDRVVLEVPRVDFDPGGVDAVLIGCPHAPPDVLDRLIDLAISRGFRVPVFVSVGGHAHGVSRGLAEKLRARNLHVVAGGCLVVSGFTKRFRVIATDSVKAAYYLPRLLGVEARLCPRDVCISAVLA